MLNNSPFIQAQGNKFFLNGQPYFFLGTNFWYGMHLGSTGEEGNRHRLLGELDHLNELGIKNLRIMASCEGSQDTPWTMLPVLLDEKGNYREELLVGMDFLLNALAERNMKAVVCLGNFWPWSGGMAQLVSWATQTEIPYPPPSPGGNWATYQLYASKFYQNNQALQIYYEHVKKIVSRINTLNKLPYREDPTIMAWQLANEPRGILKKKAYREWIKNTAKLIRELDSNHLISIGSEGATSSRWAGTRFIKDHKVKDVNYTTIHVWIQNWEWFDPLKPERSYPEALLKAKSYMDIHAQQAQELQKPLVMEEFGLSRDQNSHDPSSPTIIRDQYFEDIFSHGLELAKKEQLSGMNFWAWGGMGRPVPPGSLWKKGDVFIGDPPHEYQGWYSIYDKDESSLNLIRTYARKFAELT